MTFSRTDAWIIASAITALALSASAQTAGPPWGLCSPEYLSASDGESDDRLGYAVAADGDVMITGATGDDDQAENAGAAYVFRFDGATWTEQAKLLASDGAEDDWFGCSVAVSGQVAIIGAYLHENNSEDPGSAYVFRFDGTNWNEEAKLLASDGAEDDRFGCSVAVCGDWAVVGAMRDDDNGAASGSAYVFAFDGSAWVEHQKLLPADNAEGDAFGVSAAMTEATIIFGAAYKKHEVADGAGAAYVFRLDGSQWVEEAKLLASDGSAEDYFGRSVSICGDTAVIGAVEDDTYQEDAGSAYIFRFDGTEWIEEAKIFASDGVEDDNFGYSVAISGNLAVIGAYRSDWPEELSGSAYLFTFDGKGWQFQYKLLVDGIMLDEMDHFGQAVAVTGEQILIGSGSRNGVVCAFDHAGLLAEDCNENALCDSLEIGLGLASDCNHNGIPDECDIADGVSDDENANGIPDECEQFDWIKLLADDGEAEDEFGCSVAVEGEVLVAGAIGDDDMGEDAGAAYVFRFDGQSWVQEAKLLASDGESDDEFGRDIAISGDVIAVAAIGNDDLGANAGSVYVFRHGRRGWTQEALILASDGAEDDEFGDDIDLNGDVLIVGAYQHDGSFADSGAAYIYRDQGGMWVEEAKLAAGDVREEGYFGRGVAIEGDTAVVGAYREDANGESAGAAYVFHFDGTVWNQTQKILSSDGDEWDYFGCCAAISGDLMIVGAYRDDVYGSQDFVGSAYLFRFVEGSWQEEARVLSRTGMVYQGFGAVVALDGDLALVGDPEHWEPGSGLYRIGAAHLFAPCDTTWGTVAEIVAPDYALWDEFGESVALDGGLAVIGAWQDDDRGEDSGSVYVLPNLSQLYRDCNDNGVSDSCDLVDGYSEDCNGNLIPDECDIALGFSEDCNLNGVPDECECVYEIDDNQANAGVGFLTPKDQIWLNGFVVEPGYETIKGIAINWWCEFPPGVPTTLMVYEDPNDDGDPTDAILLRTVVVDSVFTAPDEFHVVAIDPVTVGQAGESFFVGACLTTWLMAPNSMAIDLNVDYYAASWIAAALPGEADLENLGNNLGPPVLIHESCCEGNWMLRAITSLEGPCPCDADVNGDNKVNIDDLFEILGHWGPCEDPADCPWDLSGPDGVPDGKVNIDDLFAVLGEWGPCP